MNRLPFAVRSSAAGVLAICITAATVPLGSAGAAEPVSLTIQGHRFVPDQLTVPAGQKLRIEIANADDTPEEFESPELRAEKVVVPGGKIVVLAGPLKPGTYGFKGEYHEDTAHGTITAVAKE